jgi:hypothetical protein
MTISPDDEQKIIGHMKESRQFNVRNVRDWLDLFIKTVAVLALVGTATAFTLNAVAPEWIDVPSDINSLATEVGALRVQIDRFAPQIVEFKGNLIAANTEVNSGSSIELTGVVRRNVGCETTIKVRFFNHGTNLIDAANIYEIPTVKSPVSRDFSAFTWQTRIPEDLPTGTYSYFAEIIPLECGVYERIIAPMSLPFNVTNPRG